MDYDEQYISPKKTRQIFGIATTTLISWANKGKIRYIKTPSGRRMYLKQDVIDLAASDKNNIKKTICYARVSSKKQVDDLERQISFFKSKYPNAQLVTDIASGINWKRKGLKTILEQSMQHKVKEIVVAHRDRICRFAFELIQEILTMFNVKLTVLDKEDHKSQDIELADDIMSIIHVYSCRKMGQRRYSDQSKKDKNLSNQETGQVI